jgi:hypothetical protein
MDPGTQLETDWPNRFGGGHGALHGPSWAVERGEEPVSSLSSKGREANNPERDARKVTGPRVSASERVNTSFDATNGWVREGVAHRDPSARQQLT